jgi:hypothetical protein
MPVRVTGGNQLRAVARDLRVAGSPGRGVRKKMRRNITAAVKPMQNAVKADALAIPVKGPKSTGLRKAIARGTKIKIRASGATALVRLFVDPRIAPLAAYMEGSDGARAVRWRHPVFGNTDVWVGQSSHAYFAPAVRKHLPAVRKAVVAAVDETAIELERGI